MKAKDLKVGFRYKSRGTIQEVTRIVKISAKTIEYRSKRIYPDEYDGHFYNRKSLNTEVELA